MGRNLDDINPEIKATSKKEAEKRRKYGFKKCPKCGAEHTGHTLMCRECGYRVTEEE